MRPKDISPETSRSSRKRLSPEARREQLLNGAVSAYAAQGVERAGHGDVAKLTGASTATVFNYFPTREALTDAVFDYTRETVMSAIDLAPDGEASSSPNKVLMGLLLKFSTLVENEPDLIKVILNWSVSFGDGVRPQYLAFQNDVLNVLHGAIGGAQTGAAGERTDARLIHAAALSYAAMKLDNTPDAVIGEFVKRVIGIFN